MYPKYKSVFHKEFEIIKKLKVGTCTSCMTLHSTSRYLKEFGKKQTI